jgi:hypothetical protein
MSNAVILGTLTTPIANVGPTAALYIGSPKTSSTSTSMTIEFDESKANTMKIDSSDGETTIGLDSIASGSIVYLGCDKRCTFKLNGNSFVIGDGTGTTTDGGFIFLAGSAITTLTVTAGLAVETTVTVYICGE